MEPEHKASLIVAKAALLYFTGMDLDPDQQEELAGMVERTLNREALEQIRQQCKDMEVGSGKAERFSIPSDTNSERG